MFNEDYWKKIGIERAIIARPISLTNKFALFSPISVVKFFLKFHNEPVGLSIFDNCFEKIKNRTPTTRTVNPNARPIG